MNTTPIVTPILALLKSRKFIVTLCALAINLLISAAPNLEPFRSELLVIVTGLALALIGGIAWEDAAGVGREEAGKPPQTTDALIKQLFGDLVDTIVTNAQGQTVITLKPGAYTVKASSPPDSAPRR